MKMTMSDAVEIIERESQKVRGSLHPAYTMAINAMEKQIPKKPRLFPASKVLWEYRCPTCNQALSYYQNPNENCPHHCKCGQAIDWR